MGIFNKSKTVKRNNRKSSEKGGDVVVKRLPLKSGSTVDQYLVEGVIGGGGFSIVYRCFDTVENQSVVLKEYFPNQLSRRISNDRIEPISEKKTRAFQVGMQQFFAEAHSLSQINHPNVINIINVFRAHNTAYMVSKLQAGKDLRWFIKRCQGDLDQAFVQKAIPPIMSGINALHKNKLLHLDIKPANIFLRTDGGPLLLDFGASKVMDKKERFTSFQTLTPGFAPPEQHHKQQLGPGSDIYALGATIYACITGRPPPTSLKREEKSKELTLRGAEKKITTTVIEAIRWALEMDISKRPQTLEEFADLFLKDSEWESFAAYEADLLAHAAE
jgi:serine/threonine protein kinase